MKPMLSIEVIFGGLLGALGAGGASGQDLFPPRTAPGEKRLAKEAAKLDREFVKALGGLAKKYDAAEDPEAAHFFAECAVGFGSKEEKVEETRRMTEYAVYYGKARGGKVWTAEETRAARKDLEWRGRRYEKILDGLQEIEDHVKTDLSEKGRALFKDLVPKVEIAKWAADYVVTIQDVNRLRGKMGLKAVLWDFENSRKLILAAAWWSETRMMGHECKGRGRLTGHEIWNADAAARSRKSLYYSPEEDKFAGEESGHGPASLRTGANSGYIDHLRYEALVRMSLLNPNARRIWLGHYQWWRNWECAAYQIPQLPYRTDIPTPRERYGGKTVAKDWVDTEETVTVKGKKIPYVRYPYPDEPDTPYYAGNELGWAKGEPPDGDLNKHGLPIALRFFGEADSSVLTTELRDEKGSEAKHHLYTHRDQDRVALDPKLPTVLLLPEGHLRKGATYTVTIKCRLDGVPFERTWSFATRKK